MLALVGRSLAIDQGPGAMGGSAALCLEEQSDERSFLRALPPDSKIT